MLSTILLNLIKNQWKSGYLQIPPLINPKLLIKHFVDLINFKSTYTPNCVIKMRETVHDVVLCCAMLCDDTVCGIIFGGIRVWTALTLPCRWEKLKENAKKSVY